MHPIIMDAEAFGRKAHGDQKRKYTGEPYIEHPIAVAARVWKVAHTMEQVIAALLHDVVEDTKVQLQDVIKKFGPVVGNYVWWLTDAEILKAPDGSISVVQIMGPTGKLQNANRDMRKAMNREKIARMPDAVKTIKIADMIDNSISIAQHDPNFAVVYMREKALILPLLVGGDKELWAEAEAILQQYQLSEAMKSLQSTDPK